VRFYRSIYNVVGANIVVGPEPSYETRTLVGRVRFRYERRYDNGLWNLHSGPHWYPLILAVFSIPSTWLGGKLLVMRRVATGAGCVSDLRGQLAGNGRQHRSGYFSRALLLFFEEPDHRRPCGWFT